MKKVLLIVFACFIAIQFIRIDKISPKVDKNLEIEANKEVMDIFKKACYDCHSDEVVYPWYSNIAPFSWTIAGHISDGRKALNFSKWEKYTSEEKEKKLKDIYRTVYAAMPLQSYIWLHSEADLSKEQRKMIRNWTGVRK
ncbi:MAG: heme-binding domain-containing protein [Arcobacter sp.]|nr:heme-binding domain-containing protein [Arcobacter sp.]